MRRSFWYSLSVLWLVAFPAQAGVVVNEVLSYTPSDSTLLEWIELYNDGAAAENLIFYSIAITSHDGNNSGFALSGTLQPNSFAVICRSEGLYDVRWGNGSGLWGDSAGLEDYYVQEKSFALTDSSGSVALLKAGIEVSRLAWTEPGLVSYSWERVNAASDRIEQSIAPEGSTPGHENSIAGLLKDMALEGVGVTSQNGLTNLSYTIVNRGLEAFNDDTLRLYYYDTNATDSLGALIATEPIGPVDTGYTIILIGQYSLPGTYVDLIAVLDDDNRNTNNRYRFTGVGQDYPPVILSEFLANPTEGPDLEWVELRNRSDQPVNLIDWQLGDSLDLSPITDAELLIQPGHYLVLVQNTIGFLSMYSDFSGSLFEPVGWEQFNNSSDIVRLIDQFGIEADRFHYTEVFEDNHTWARAESGERAGEWGFSQDPGGTPGEANTVLFSSSEDNRLAIEIEPKIISPDGDGVDDRAVFSLSRPEATAYTLKIYDKMGREVKTFESDLSSSHFSNEYVWDGTNNSHERLPIGIYIVYFEASGVQSIKSTVVIAR